MAPHLPVLGEYFVFRLDPTQTLNLALNDQEVSEACEALGARCKRYIGCCVGWTGVPRVGTLFSFEMSMVSRGLATYPKGFVTEDMSLPILPTLYHPRGRKRLVVDPPLPWDNRYHATPATMIARVLYRERDVRLRGKHTLLPRHQTCVLGFQRTDDDQWREKLRNMHETSDTDFEPPPIEDQEGIEEFYESLKNELDPSQLPDLNEDIPNENEELADPCLEATNDPTDLFSLNRSDQGSSAVETDSTSRITSYDSLREEVARRFDCSPVIDLTVDLETVPFDELADNAARNGKVRDPALPN